MTYIYKDGLTFSKKLAENIEDLKARIDNNKASLVIIDGGIGEGKTTLAVHLADYYNKLCGLDKINLKDQLALGGEDFLKKLRLCFMDKLPVLIYDEAGDFNRRGALTRFNALINRTFETYRAFKILVILVLPSFKVLDIELFDKQIPRLLLHVKDRSRAQGNFLGYSLYRMRYIKARMDKLIVPTFAYGLVEPNFYGHYLDLVPERSQKLDLISTKGKLAVMKKGEIAIKGLFSYKDLSNKLGRSIIWVRKAVSELNIKETETIDKAKYFGESTLNRLAEHLDNK